MLIFLKGIIVGIGKIIPGVSGALLAVNLGIYEKLIVSITNFFDDVKDNIKFLVPFILGIIMAIIIGSNVIEFLLNNYKFITMSFFLGLIIGGTYLFSKKIAYNYINIIVIIIFLLFAILFSLISFNYHFSNSVFTYFIGGYIEIIASIVPGISATALLIALGIYDNILHMVANLYNINYIICNIYLYISYILGMFMSFIINIYIIKYIIYKYKSITYTLILCLSIMSIIYLIVDTFKLKYSYIELIIGTIMFVGGIIISKLLNEM